MDEVILKDSAGGKVVPHINEGGQGAGGESFDSLHGGGGRIGPEGVQPGLGRPRRSHLVQNGQFVLESSGRGVPRVITSKVSLQGVDYEDDGSAEARLLQAEVSLHISPWGKDVRTGAGPVEDRKSRGRCKKGAPVGPPIYKKEEAEERLDSGFSEAAPVQGLGSSRCVRLKKVSVLSVKTCKLTEKKSTFEFAVV